MTAKKIKKINRGVLKKISNPVSEPYEIKLDAPEFTFYGSKNQPDYAFINITTIPDKSVIELKSFKIYLQQFRNIIFSYERVINIIYDDLMSTYKPKRLVISMEFNPRGGISSTLTVDSFERELFIERNK